MTILAAPTVKNEKDVQTNFDALAGWIKSGRGSPENVVAANIGVIYLRQDGGIGTTFYVKEQDSGGKTGWAAK